MDELSSGREPAPPRWRISTRRSVTMAIVAVVMLLVAAGTELVLQRSQLRATRADVGDLQSALSKQGARLGTLEESVGGLQQNSTFADVPADVSALAAKVTPSIVTVACGTASLSDTGSGFALALPAVAGSTTVIVTAERVINGCVDNASGNILTLIVGTQVVTAQIQGFDRDNNVAILSTSASLPALQPGDAPVVGEPLVAVGHALGNLTNSDVVSGSVSAVYDAAFVDTAAISNGNAGGPVVDRAGRVVGMAIAGQLEPQVNSVVENLNISLRLSALCLHLLSGPACAALH